jgi:hypothetical protein
MKIIALLLCVLLSACVRNPAPSEPVPTQPPVLQEFAPLTEMHARFLTFRDDDIFLRYGFTFNSPYADWLQRVREFEHNPTMAESARLLAGLAVAARIHGAKSEVYRQFEMRFDQSVRAPVEEESVEQGPDVQVLVDEEPMEQESELQESVEQEPMEQESELQASVEQESMEQEPVDPVSVEKVSVEQGSAEQLSVAQKAVLGSVASSALALASGVSILFSGDTQGVVYPQPGPFGSVGGLARRTSTIAHFRMEYPGVVLLDAGDTFTSGFERAEKINKVLVRAMNHLRYDAMGLGGLDLAMGEVSLRELAAMAKFPMVCSNLEFQQGFDPWIKSYVIFERNGRRIAVLSVLAAPSGAVITGARFVAPEKALGALLPKLRSSVDFVVLLTQLGSEEAAELLGEGSVVDVILGDRNAASMTSPAYVPAVPKGLGLGLLRLNKTAPGAPARVESMPVLLGTDSDAQLIQILDELN